MLSGGMSEEIPSQTTIADLTRQQLCTLGREYLLIGHLQDRVSLPLIAGKLGGEAYVELAIDEWMGASPIYSKRVQRALRFEGDDVETVFKNLQFDIGAPHQFMDFQFRLDRPDYGEFWLSHCGALLDVEPFGERSVQLMCHAIEDPTFDATAAATHPQMKMRPIHRPPREPSDRYPHCRWSVFIDDRGADYEQHPNLALVAASKLASVGIVDDHRADDEPGGWNDYACAFDPGFQLEDLSHEALHASLQEFAIQAHLLARSLLLNVAQKTNEETAREIASRQWIGIAALAAERVQRAMEIEGDGLEAIAGVLALHPHFYPRSYIDFSVKLAAANELRITIGPSPALEEGDHYSWFATLGHQAHPALEAMVGAINPRARCVPDPNAADGRLAWKVFIDPDAEPSPEPPELGFARMSRGAGFVLEQRRPLRV